MRHLLLASTALLATPLHAQTVSVEELRAMRAELDRQAAIIAAQRARIDALENEFLAQQRGRQAPPANTAGNAAAAVAPGTVTAPQLTVEATNGAPATVGVAPDSERSMPEVASLSETGGIITRPGRLTVEPGLEYARADRNRVIFRGIEVPQSVLVGVFDINEIRQDILTASLGFRYGLTSRFELNARVPYVY